MATRIIKAERLDSSLRITIETSCCRGRRPTNTTYTGNGRNWKDPRGRRAPASIARILSEYTLHYLQNERLK